MPSRQIKGLTNFIADVRACASRDLEERRVEKEVAKIRQRFAAGKQLDGYERKKCVWKLVYIAMLGYEIPFGQMEALNLISSNKFSEKAAGYLASSALLVGNSDVLGLATNLIKIDLSHPNEAIAALALNFLANVATDDMIEMLFNDIQRIIHATYDSRSYIRRKAYLVMLRFVRKKPEILPPEIWAPRFAEAFQSERDVGSVTSLASLINGVLELHQTGWQPVVPHIINILHRVNLGDVPQYAMYIGVPAPWLQIKLLRILQFFTPSTDKALISKIREVLEKIITHAPTLPKVNTQSGQQQHKRRTKADQERLNRCNIEHAIFFEAANLILIYENILPFSLKRQAAMTLCNTSNIKDGSIRYLRLECLARLANEPEVITSLQTQLKDVMSQVNDSDEMIRRQALNLLFSICSNETWEMIVDHLLETLKTADPTLQEEIVLKAAILVEKFASDFTWYIDTVFTMIEYAPTAVCELVWHRVVQMLNGQNQTLQIHAARKAYDALSDVYCAEVMVRLGSYLLGEFGHLITDEASGRQQLSALNRHFIRVTPQTKSMLLLSYAKLLNAHEDLSEKVLDIVDSCSQAADIEVQQRAIELIELSKLDSDLLDSVLAEMPAFPTTTLKTSPLMRRLKFCYKMKAADREFLEEAAKTEGPLLKPSTNKPEIESEEETSEGLKDESDDHSSQTSFDSETSSSSRASEIEEKKKGKPKLDFPPVDESNPLLLFKRACLMSEGILFANPLLHIKFKHQYKPPIGRVALELVNDAAVPIQIQNCLVEPSSSLNIVNAITIPNGTVLQSKQSIKHCLQVDLLHCFMTPPKYFINLYVPSNYPKPQMSFSTSIPVILTNFITPTILSSQNFKKYWDTANQNKDSQNSFMIGSRNPEMTSPSLFAFYLSEGFHFYTQNFRLTIMFDSQSQTCFGLQIEKSICGSGTLHSTVNDHPTSIACLVRINFDVRTSKIIVAVRVPNPLVARPLLHLLSSYFISSEIPNGGVQTQPSINVTTPIYPMPALPAYTS